MKKLIGFYSALFVVYFGIFMQDIFFEPFTTKIEDFLDPYISKKVSAKALIGIGLTLFVAIDLYLQIKKKQLDQEKQSIKEEKEQLHHQMQTLSFNIGGQKLKDFITKFTKEAYKRHYVIATQIYRYEFSKTNYMLNFRYEEGFVVKGERMNAVIQESFQIDGPLYREFENAIKAIETKSEFELIQQFIVKCKTVLDKYSKIKNINRELNHFLLLVLALQYVANIQSETTLVEPAKLGDFLKYKRKQEKLYTLSKTGLIRSILNTELKLSSFYNFEHIGEGDKNGRVYLSVPINRKDDPEPYIFLITISPKIDQENNQGLVMAETLNEFFELIQEEIEVVEINQLGLVV